MTKGKNEIKNHEDNFYVDTQSGNKGKVFQKKSGSKGNEKIDKNKVVCYFCKKEVTSRKIAIRGNKIARKRKAKELIEQV